MPVGAHMLLSFLAEPLKQLSEASDTLETSNVSENLREFQDWVCICLFREFGEDVLNFQRILTHLSLK